MLKRKIYVCCVLIYYFIEVRQLYMYVYKFCSVYNGNIDINIDIYQNSLYFSFYDFKLIYVLRVSIWNWSNLFSTCFKICYICSVSGIDLPFPYLNQNDITTKYIKIRILISSYSKYGNRKRSNNTKTTLNLLS